jgi:hypothetical protein
MPNKMPNKISNIMPKDLPNKMAKNMPEICQIK